MLFADASDYDRIQVSDRIACDDLHKLLEGGGDLVNTTQGYRFEVKTALTERQRRILLDGGLCATWLRRRRRGGA